MLNRVILIGRLTKDPELRFTPSGVAVATFSLAVDRQRPNQDGDREADFINIVVWQKLGELCAEYLKKGRMAAVDGRLQIRSYENNQGQKVRVAEVIAENVRFLDKGETTQTSSQPSTSQGFNYSFQENSTGNSGFGSYQSDPFENPMKDPFDNDDNLPF